MGSGKPPTSHRDRVFFGAKFRPVRKRDPRDYRQDVIARPVPSKFRGRIAWDPADIPPVINDGFQYDLPFDLEPGPTNQFLDYDLDFDVE